MSRAMASPAESGSASSNTMIVAAASTVSMTSLRNSGQPPWAGPFRVVRERPTLRAMPVPPGREFGSEPDERAPKGTICCRIKCWVGLGLARGTRLELVSATGDLLCHRVVSRRPPIPTPPEDSAARRVPQTSERIPSAWIGKTRVLGAGTGKEGLVRV